MSETANQRLLRLMRENLHEKYAKLEGIKASIARMESEIAEQEKVVAEEKYD